MNENHNGLECVKLVKQFLSENEIIEPLILVLKQFLKVNGLNDPYYGGLSSYALFLMIVSFLQMHQVPKSLCEVNLGQVLLNFIQVYSVFDNEGVGIYTIMPGKPPEKLNHYPLNTVRAPCSSLISTACSARMCRSTTH